MTRLQAKAALVSCYSMLTSLHWLLVGPRSTPVLYHDGAGYLMVARFLAGLEPLNTLTTPYTHFGYSLALIPAWRLGQTPEQVYRFALQSNGLMAASLIFPLYLLGRRMLQLGRGAAMGLAIATSLYPTYLLNSGLVWAESLLPSAWCWFILAANDLWRRPSDWRAFLASCWAIILLALHPRGAIAAVLLICCLPVLVRRLSSYFSALRPLRLVATVAITLVVGFAGFARIAKHIQSRVWELGEGRGADLMSRALTRLQHLAEPSDLAIAVVGHTWYVLVATLGIALMGVAVLLQPAASRSSPPALVIMKRIAVSGFFLSVIVSILFTASPDPRMDLPIYGRYAEAFLAPVLLAGLVTLCHSTGTETRRPLLIASFVISFLGLGLIAVYGDPSPTGPMVPHTIHGVLAYGYSYQTLPLATASIGSAGLAALAWWASQRFRWTVMAVVVALALGSVQQIESQLYYPLDIENHRLFTLDRTIRASALEGPIGYDLHGRDETALNAYKLALPGYRFIHYDSAHDPPPADLVIANEQPTTANGTRWTPLSEEVSRPQTLWMRASPGLDGLRESGVSTTFEAESLYSGVPQPWRLTEVREAAPAASVRSNARASRGDSKFLIEGPRIRALPGSYRLIIRGSLPTTTEVQVTIDHGSKILARETFQQTFSDASLHFELAEPVSDLELRVENSAGIMEVDSLTLTRFLPPFTETEHDDELSFDTPS